MWSTEQSPNGYLNDIISTHKGINTTIDNINHFVLLKFKDRKSITKFKTMTISKILTITSICMPLRQKGQ